MSMISIKCPTTGHTIATGIETDQATFEKLPDVPSSLRCPVCKGEHVWRISEAWLAHDRLIAGAA